ncbi:hypothetical protein ACFLXY_06415 [Chloroflexota bacterium]
MTLNIEELESTIARKYSQYEKIEESTIRFVKEFHENPYAVCFITIPRDGLPNTLDKLTQFQDRIVGKTYFRDEKRLQWNNYLYFVMQEDESESTQLLQIKQMIENNRDYARKYVIKENEVENVLNPQYVSPSIKEPKENILTTWTNIINNAGLNKAIFTDHYLPERIKIIEKSSQKIETTPLQKGKVGQKYTNIPFIDLIKFINYRRYPTRREFNFGKVNLIYGPNASGKTSLLEAIELYYCGKNKRNPDYSPKYKFEIRLRDGSVETVDNTRSKQIFRDHNLEWYGQSEVKTHNIYLSFSRFNYLNTDAAYALSQESLSQNKLEEDLAQLLVGPDAAKIWKNIERLKVELKSHVNDQKSRRNELNEDLKSINDNIDFRLENKKNVDRLRKRIEKSLNSRGWDIPSGDNIEFANSLFDYLSGLESLLERIGNLNLHDNVLSITELTKYFDKYTNVLKEAEDIIIKINRLSEQKRAANEELITYRHTLSILTELQNLVKAKIPNRIAEINEKTDIVSRYSSILAGVENISFSILEEEDIDLGIGHLSNYVADKYENETRELERLGEELVNFRTLRDETEQLFNELRQIALQILANEPQLEECPLCHTHYSNEELTEHINKDIENPFEKRYINTVLEENELKKALMHTTDLKEVIDWIVQYSKLLDLSLDIPVSEYLTMIQQYQDVLFDTENRLKAIDQELKSLEEKGLSRSRYSSIVNELADSGYSLEVYSIEKLSQIELDVKKKIAVLSENLIEFEIEIQAQSVLLKDLLPVENSDIKEYQRVINNEKLALEELVHLLNQLQIYHNTWKWPNDESFHRLRLEIKKIDKDVNRLYSLYSVFDSDTMVSDTIADLNKRKRTIEKDLDNLNIKFNRCSAALRTLNEIDSKYSLQNAMKTTINEHRREIETIFSYIHNPAEFSGLGSSIYTLIREEDGSEANLTTISTGQRTAFALSIFLALNMRLSTAPPILLIDDPIAYIDDLNSLSFLDYLREIVIRGDRQIFFTTANEKMASLFERKFNFLNNDFCKIKLSREIE